MQRTQRRRIERRRTERRYLVLALALLASLAAAGGVVWADVAGSAHDFSAQAWSNGEICLPCHTPHNATGPSGAPLWNHELTQATFIPYSSATMDPGAPVGQPGAVSKLCLSCHDGTVATDSFGGATGGSNAPAAVIVGTDLSDDHPIGMSWIHQTSAVTCTNCHTSHPWSFTSVLPFFKTAENRTIECATCHDPHDKANQPNLLRISNTGSALCLHCHGK